CAFFFSRVRYYGTYTKLLFEKFVGALQDCIVSIILPSLEGKEGVAFLMEIMENWAKYKTMAHWLVRFFHPLRGYCSNAKGTQLNDLPFHLICDWVFDPMWGKLRGEVIHLINLQRGGGVVNGDLLKAVIELIAEIEIRGRRNYFRNFEQELIADAVNRYGNLAAKWFLICSLNEYMEKATRCILMEERSTNYYLPQTTMKNVIEVNIVVRNL
ncbi:Cullin-1 like, partial [Actinidia chinensis var. chinensis]